MTSSTAQQIVNAVSQVGSKMRGSDAHAIVVAWIRGEFNAERDQWGKYRNPDGTRWDIGERAVRRQGKTSDGRWYNIKTYGLIDLAVVLAASAEKVAGVSGAGSRLKTSRVEEKKVASDKSRDKALREQASILSAKYMAFAYPDDVRKTLSGVAVDDLKRLVDKQREVTDEYLAGLREGKAPPDDSNYASVDNPPILPLYRRINYRWEETQDGVTYSIRVENAERHSARVHIGVAGAGWAQIDPLSHRMQTYSGPELKGDGNADGSLAVSDDGKIVASLFFVSASQRKSGAGSRLLALWCRMMKGYNVERWLGEAVGDEGMGFLKALDAKGKIKIEAEKDRYLVVSCR